MTDLRAREAIRTALAAPRVWVPPIVLMALLVTLMTLVYLGSIIDPTGHLKGLPVLIVNQDQGSVGQQLTAGLTSAKPVTDRLDIEVAGPQEARRRMDEGKAYVTVVIPPGFSRSLRAIGGGEDTAPLRATLQLLTNPRAGTVGVTLANGVLMPALAEASQRLSRQLQATGRATSFAERALLADPVVVKQVAYRPPPSRSGLGLSAFYIAILTTFCGFLAGVILHTSLDGVLGYATIEAGPRWTQRQPASISRWHTLLAKWVAAVPLTLAFTGLMLLAATAVLGMDAPHLPQLWLLAWVSAAVIAIGTLTLFAVLGTPGQIAALLIFVYLSLASSGGTVPLEALGGFFQLVAEFEPMRQIIAGTRSILYFDASASAGLTRAFAGAFAGLVFWLVIGATVTRWYDRKGLHRASPALLDYIDTAVRGYRAPGPDNAS
jgi:YhgE/Pip-like protein